MKNFKTDWEEIDQYEKEYVGEENKDDIPEFGQLVQVLFDLSINQPRA